MAWVREPSNKALISVQDFNGVTATSEYWVAQAEGDPASGAPAAIADALQGISAGAVVSVELMSRAAQSAPATPGTGPYDSVQDKLKLEYSCADGSKIVIQLPGPKATTLNSTNFYVDGADSLIAALTAALITNGKNAQGSAIVALAGGNRRIPPGLKRR